MEADGKPNGIYITQTIDDIEKFQALLVRASDDELMCYFRCRNNLDKDAKYKIRNMIWTECKKRYDLPTNPIEIRMPYFDQLDAREIRGKIVVAINKKTWPIEIKQWYIRNTKIITEGNKSIDDILSNVMKPQHTQGPCVCERVHLRCGKRLTTTNGHILTIGREYDGIYKEVLQTAATNIPRQTQWDLKVTWERAYKQLPQGLMAEESWTEALMRCVKPQVSKPDVRYPTSRDAYMLRKALDGLVIGPMDKNKGELWMCCPVLYNQALQKMYSEKTGYDKINCCGALYLTSPGPGPLWVPLGALS